MNIIIPSYEWFIEQAAKTKERTRNFHEYLEEKRKRELEENDGQ